MKRTIDFRTVFSALVVSVLSCAQAGLAADTPKGAVSSASSGITRSEYRLGPEDVIEVFVWKEPELSTTVALRPDGRISLPLAGEFDASGKTTAQLQNEIATQLTRYITEPVVNVMVKQINSLKISVLGEVRKP
ncbi:MAG TPA: polysaccharide biosynthesis/export family protein, partial [Bryobacteraceae bacterium]